MRRVRLVHLLAIAAVAIVPLCATTAARADDGAAIFSAKCAACHSIGKGKLVGPDLKGITSKEPHDWLVKWISSPSKMVQSGDATATALVKQYPMQMPDLGLSESDVNAVITYIGQQSGGAAAGSAAAAAPAQSFPAGDSIRGRELFIGGQRLTHGGPPCMSCHSISGIGALGGGTLGPDLTGAYQKYGGTAGLENFISGLPTPTMNAVWSRNPLTPQEIADVTAFIKEAAVQERPLSSIGPLIGLSILGLIIAAIIIGTIWRRRLLSVRIAMYERTTGGPSAVSFTHKLTGRS
jgi:mono/diheme cytochrome c family protein